MDCGCKGTKKVTQGKMGAGTNGGHDLFGKKKMTVTKNTTKKSTRMTFKKK